MTTITMTAKLFGLLSENPPLLARDAITTLGVGKGVGGGEGEAVIWITPNGSSPVGSVVDSSGDLCKVGAIVGSTLGVGVHTGLRVGLAEVGR